MRTHPVFARCYSVVAGLADRAGGDTYRRELLADLTGRVVEVGAGTGANFRYYPPTVTQVTAVEPEPTLRRTARKAAATSVVPVHVIDGTAEVLPLSAGSVDAAVASLVLCSVVDQAEALAEILRVLRPGGELRFFEHVRADTPGRERLQRLLDPLWPRLAGGCRLTRDTGTAITAAGFVMEDCRRLVFQPCLLAAPVASVLLGRARRPDCAEPAR